MSPHEFIDALIPISKGRIPQSFVIAQAALESRWGNSQLALQANNLFGIKADPSWTGPTIEMGTQEIVTGGSVAEMATWRRYPSWQACIADHAQFFPAPHHLSDLHVGVDTPRNRSGQLTHQNPARAVLDPDPVGFIVIESILA